MGNSCYGCSPALHELAHTGDARVLERYLDRSGVNPDRVDAGEQTALHVAAFEGHRSVAELLLQRGASVDALDRTSRSPLHLAAQQGNLVLVELLLDHGAQIDRSNVAGWTALHFACFSGRVTVVELLLNRGAQLPAHDVEMVKDSLDTDEQETMADGFDEKTNHTPKTPLQLARAGKHIELEQLLTQHVIRCQSANNDTTPSEANRATTSSSTPIAAHQTEGIKAKHSSASRSPRRSSTLKESSTRLSMQKV